MLTPFRNQVWATALTWRRCLATVASERVQRPQTLIEKVIQRYALDLPSGKTLKAGDYVMIRPEYCMTHDNTAAVINKFKSIGAKQVKDRRQLVFTIDHDVQNKSDKNLAKYASIEAFARSHNVDFYPSGRGIGHQILIEEGYAFPNCLVVASDSHSNMYGGVGCVGTPVVRTDAASIWATGKTWWQLPRMVKVELKGCLSPGVTGKDVIVALCGSFNRDEVLNAAIEFTGEGVATLTVDDRLTISNMTTEWGALAGVFPVDNVLLDWYDRMVSKLGTHGFTSKQVLTRKIPPLPEHPRINHSRLADLRASPIMSDADATYASHLVFDLSSLVPHVSGPNSVKISTPLPTLEASQIAIQKAYLVSCTNSRASDIAAAARVVKGRRVAPGVQFYVAAASSIVQSESELSGAWGTLLAAGAKALPPGCGPCIGLGTGLLEKGETGISATNRNFRGRMGHPEAQAYLASPAVVAASAVKGVICGPDSLGLSQGTAYKYRTREPVFTINNTASFVPPTMAPSEEQLVQGFPSVFSGPLLFVPQDNLNTDAIYPGKYTYQDDITLERQGQVVMENYDPSFAKLVADIVHTQPPASSSSTTKHGVILVSGYNFGTGSSREQAATALKASGISLVVAGSFGDIFKRNAINNGLVCMESPELLADLSESYASGGLRGQGGKNGELTVNPGCTIEVQMATGRVSLTSPNGRAKIYQVRPVGSSVQELWTCGGLEGFILKSIASEV